MVSGFEVASAWQEVSEASLEMSASGHPIIDAVSPRAL